MDRSNFISIRNQYLSAARPIETPERLKGRDELFRKLTNALESPGRHCFIYGLRGVGKSSLAHTAAFQVQSSHGIPVLISCESTSSFESICEDIVNKAISINKLEKKGQFQLNLGLPYNLGGIQVRTEGKRYENITNYLKTSNGTADVLRKIVEQLTVGLIIVVDEFDQIKDKECHNRFASLIKIVSDQNINVKFIFCGISKSLEDLFKAHESINRQIVPIEVERLSIQSCLDILKDAANALEIELEDGFQYRIAKISDGFPAFVHLIAENIFTKAFDNNLHSVDSDSYYLGLTDAIETTIFSFRDKYERFAHLYTKANEHVLWSIAYDKVLVVSTEDIYNNYIHIVEQLKTTPIRRPRLSQRLNVLCKEDGILERIRRSNFTFKEQMMRPYARLRAEKFGVKLGPENPNIIMGRSSLIY